MKAPIPTYDLLGGAMIFFVLGMGTCGLYVTVAGPINCTNDRDTALYGDEKPCTSLQRVLDREAAAEYYGPMIEDAREEGYEAGYRDGTSEVAP